MFCVRNVQEIARELNGVRNREDISKRKEKNMKKNIYLKAKQVGKRKKLLRDVQKISPLFM
jgi:hypothetical protein